MRTPRPSRSSGWSFSSKPGVVLDYETKTSYAVTIEVDDVSVGSTPDAFTGYTLLVDDEAVELPPAPALIISEVAPWSSGDSPVGADWFEVTNTSESPVDITGWKVDDGSADFSKATALNGITTLAAGESVIFIESDTPSATAAGFHRQLVRGKRPGALQIGTYSGSAWA